MKKHIKKFEGFRNKSENIEAQPIKDEAINEFVTQIGEDYEVTVSKKVPSKLIAAYCKKVEQNTNKKLTDTYGSAMIAEKLVMWVLDNCLDVEKIPANALTGGAQTAQAQSQAPTTDGQAQAQAPAQPMADAAQITAQPATSAPVSGQGPSTPDTMGGDDLPI